MPGAKVGVGEKSLNNIIWLVPLNITDRHLSKESFGVFDIVQMEEQLKPSHKSCV